MNSFDKVEVGKSLPLFDGSPLRYFEAIDGDGGIFGDVTFNLNSANDDHLSFEMVRINRKQSELRLTQRIEEKTYLVESFECMKYLREINH